MNERVLPKQNNVLSVGITPYMISGSWLLVEARIKATPANSEEIDLSRA